MVRWWLGGSVGGRSEKGHQGRVRVAMVGELVGGEATRGVLLKRRRVQILGVRVLGEQWSWRGVRAYLYSIKGNESSETYYCACQEIRIPCILAETLERWPSCSATRPMPIV